MAKNKNITLSLESELIALGKRYATAKGTSLNQIIREFLERTVGVGTDRAEAEELLAALDEAAKSAHAGKWRRDDAYDV